MTLKLVFIHSFFIFRLSFGSGPDPLSESSVAVTLHSFACKGFQSDKRPVEYSN
jgi:hypothetical protein